jgi:hypothetical protein
MSTAWWLITSAAAFGWAATILPLLPQVGASHVIALSRPPGAALTAQALVLWGAGTSVTGTVLSFAAGFAVMAVAARIQRRRES